MMLEQRAQSALVAGDIEGALELFQQLELQHKEEPVWSKQVASLHQRLGNEEECVKALFRAADRCAARREPIKAIAAGKMLLAIRPGHKETEDLIRRVLGRPRTASQIARAKKIPPPGKTPLAVLPLVRMAQPRQPIGDDEQVGIYEIPLQLSAAQDPRVEPEDFELDLLPPIPLFSALSAESFQGLLDRSRLFRIEEGQVLFRQGEPGEALYVVIEGGVSVYLEELDAKREKIADLSEGSFFGEIALFTDRPRGATIIASRNTELLEIDRMLINELAHAEPEVLDVLMTFLRGRLVDTILRSSALFQTLSEKEVESLRTQFNVVDVDEGAQLIDEGTMSRGLFVVVDGSLDVVRESGHVAVLHPGHVCGEISTMTNHPAVASVHARERSLLLMLPQEKVKPVVGQHPKMLAYVTQLAADRMRELQERERIRFV